MEGATATGIRQRNIRMLVLMAVMPLVGLFLTLLSGTAWMYLLSMLAVLFFGCGLMRTQSSFLPPLPEFVLYLVVIASVIGVGMAIQNLPHEYFPEF